MQLNGFSFFPFKVHQSLIIVYAFEECSTYE